MFIVENGLGAVDGRMKMAMWLMITGLTTLAYVKECGEAINEDGVVLWGYTTWGCIDPSISRLAR